MALPMRRFTQYILILLCYKPIQSCNVANLYLDNNRKGWSYLVRTQSCFDLPSSVAGQVSSVGVFDDNCIRLYDNYYCRGNHIELRRRYPKDKLSDWKFDDVAKSIGSCSCPLIISDSEEETRVTFFTREVFKGILFDVNVSGCTQIPFEYQNQTKSVNLHGNCIQLYENSECNYEYSDDFIELHPYSPFKEYLSSVWNFRVVKAISRCNYKCLNTSFLVPKEGDIILFEFTNFKGEKYNLSLLSTQCVHLPISWQGLAESIGVGFDTCVTLFERKDCSGTQHQINESISNLSTVNFGGRIRSLGSCDPYILATTIPTTGNTTQNLIPSTTEIPVTTYPTIFSIITTVISTNFSNGTEYHKYTDNNQRITTDFSPLLIAVLVVVSLFAVILFVVACYVIKHGNPFKEQKVKLSGKEIREFLSGIGIDLMTNVGGPTRNENDYSTEFLAQNSAYNMDFEIDRSCIEIDPGSILGSGEFGVVYKGMLTFGNENNSPPTYTTDKTTVAIKTVNPTSGLNALWSLLKEVKVMLYMGHHENIAKLIGCCTDKIREGDIMVILEYCSEGSLESYKEPILIY